MGLSQSAIWRMETKPTRPKRATVERLANILGVDQTQILGPVLPAQPDHGGYRKGENHPAAKVTEEIVSAIRKEYAAGTSCKELSIKFGLKYTTTHHIVRKTTWKSVN
jgi:transcriptional regulator with XRE-family HTH domain